MTPREITTELEWLRFTAPEKALELAQERAEQASRHVLPLYLGEWAAALRAMGKTKDARGVAMVAIRAAKRWGKPSVLGDVIQKLAYVEAYRGDFGQAVALAEKALVLHAEDCYTNGIGRCLGDQGYVATLQRDYAKGLNFFESALHYLDEDDRLARFSCSMNASFCCQQLALEDDRRAFLDEALKHQEDVPEGMLMRAKWEEVEVRVLEGKYDGAAQTFKTLASYFLERDQIPQAALATCELVQVLLKQKRIDEAFQVAKTLAPLVMDLSDDSVTAAAITEILRATGATHRELAAAVRDAASKIKDELTRPPR